MSIYSKRDSCQINYKKRDRIIKEEEVLKLEKRLNRSCCGRKFMKFRKVITATPLECLEMDIKMV
jgi:hypothetical protein